LTDRLRVSSETGSRTQKQLGPIVGRYGHETRSCKTVIGQQGWEHGRRGIYGVVSRYLAMTGEDTANWEDLVRAVLNCGVRELVIAL
jgi:hypothetical protein